MADAEEWLSEHAEDEGNCEQPGDGAAASPEPRQESPRPRTRATLDGSTRVRLVLLALRSALRTGDLSWLSEGPNATMAAQQFLIVRCAGSSRRVSRKVRHRLRSRPSPATPSRHSMPETSVRRSAHGHRGPKPSNAWLGNAGVLQIAVYRMSTGTCEPFSARTASTARRPTT